MSRDIDLVVFDCDGVLVDSEPLAVRIDALLLARAGWPLSDEEIVSRFLGRTTADIRAEVAKHVTPEIAQSWDAEFPALFRDACARELQPVDGIREALARIEGAGLQTCVASSGSHEKMRLTLGTTGLFSRFDGRIFSAEEVARGKPWPDLFLHAASRMGIDPSRCVVVEDSRFGIEAAHAATMRAFGYAGGLSPASWLQVPGAQVFRDMRELPGLLGLLEIV